jgi:glycosyltransferase involved in cell wall biosynthesis
VNLASMKIALIAPTSETASCATRLFFNYAAAMAARGHQVTVYFPGPVACPGGTGGGRIRVRCCPKWLAALSFRGGFGLGEMVYKCVQLLANHFDCVHVCPGHRPANLIPAVAAKRIRGSVIVDEWWEWFGKGGCSAIRRGLTGACVAAYDSLLEVRAKHAYDGVIAITEGLRSRLPGHAHVDVLHGGAEVNALIRFDRCESRRMLGYDEHLLILGMSGLTRNDHGDNLPLFDAVRSLSDELPTLRLLTTGNPKYLSEEVQPLLPRGILLNAGWVDFATYNRCLSACDAFVLPFPDTCRNRNRWPNKIGDYLTLERPIITNPTGDVASFFREHGLGHLCDNASQAYQIAIRTLAERADREESPQSRLAARLLSFESRVDRILEFYERLQRDRREGMAKE